MLLFIEPAPALSRKILIKKLEFKKSFWGFRGTQRTPFYRLKRSGKKNNFELVELKVEIPIMVRYHDW